MPYGTVLAILFVHLGFYAAFIAYWMLAGGVASQWVARSRQQYDRPVRATLVGFVGLLLPLFAGIQFAKSGKAPIVALGIGIFMLLILIGLFGSAGLADRIGSGLKSGRDEQEPWRRIRRGGMVLGVTFIPPILGWFIVLPWTLISGLGAFLLAWPRTSAAPAPAVQPVTQ